MAQEQTSPKARPDSRPTKPPEKPGENVPEVSFEDLLKQPKGSISKVEVKLPSE